MLSYYRPGPCYDPLAIERGRQGSGVESVKEASKEQLEISFCHDL